MIKKLVLIILIIVLFPLISSQEITWVLGDSLSLNYEGIGYPPQFDKLTGYNLSDYNLAFGGMKCDYVIESEIPKIDSGDYALVLCGTNDIYQGENYEQIINDLEEIYFLLINKNITPILLSIFPHKPIKNCNLILEINFWMNGFALENNLTFIDTHSILVDKDGCSPKKGLFSDYVHLNEKGNDLLAELIFNQGFNKSNIQISLESKKHNIFRRILMLFQRL